MSGIALPAALAAAPIVLILALMLGLHWSAANAGMAALALAAVLAVTVFDFGSAAAQSAGGWRDAAGVVAEGGFLALTILWILWPALALHRLQDSGGAIATLRSGLGRLSDSPAKQALLVGWLLALFFEGAAGFGTPVALAAPLLVSLGFAPVQAVVLALLGHAAGVSFGALGTPVLAQVALTGLDAVEIALTTALLHAALGGVLMLFFVRMLAATGAAPGLAWPALAALGFFVPSVALAAWLGPELATLGGALVGALIFVAALARAGRRPHAPAATDTAAAASGAVLRAIAPYLVLVALVVATRAIAPLAAALGEVALSWELFGRYQARMLPLTHPGTLLMLSLLIGARLQRATVRNVGDALMHAARQLRLVTIALLAMLVLSRLMLHGGLIDALERAAVAGIGSAWPWIAPAVGALGSFVTGSATASNVLLTTLQAQTAQALALPAVVMVAAQGFGAAVGNIICPHNIVAGAATVGLAGREGEILRRTLGPCLLYLALGGAAVAALAALGW